MRGLISKSTVRALLLVALGSAVTLFGIWLLDVTGDGGAAAAPAANSAAAPVPERPDAWKLPLGPMAIHDEYEPVNGKGGQEITGPYTVAKNWPPPVVDGWQISAEGFYPESPDRILVVGYGWRKRPFLGYWGPAFMGGYNGGNMMARGEDVQKNQYMIVVFDRNGKAVETWDHYIPILGPNQMQLIHPNVYDPERPLWISTSGHLVQLSRDGKKHLRTIDETALPPDHPQKEFLMIEHFAFASNGDLFASGAASVTRFSKDGKYLSHFGKPGTGPGEFGMTANRHAGGVHGIQIDSQRNRVYVADRILSRIQVFDMDGNFLDLWPNIVGPYAIRLTADGRHLWVGDGAAMKIQKYDALTGKLVPGSTWGTFGNAPGAWLGLHYFTTDSEGNLYTGEDFGWRLQKYVPRQDGNPAQLIGPLMN